MFCYCIGSEVPSHSHTQPDHWSVVCHEPPSTAWDELGLPSWSQGLIYYCDRVPDSLGLPSESCERSRHERRSRPFGHPQKVVRALSFCDCVPGSLGLPSESCERSRHETHSRPFGHPQKVVRAFSFFDCVPGPLSLPKESCKRDCHKMQLKSCGKPRGLHKYPHLFIDIFPRRIDKILQTF